MWIFFLAVAGATVGLKQWGAWSGRYLQRPLWQLWTTGAKAAPASQGRLHDNPCDELSSSPTPGVVRARGAMWMWALFTCDYYCHC